MPISFFFSLSKPSPVILTSQNRELLELNCELEIKASLHAISLSRFSHVLLFNLSFQLFLSHTLFFFPSDILAFSAFDNIFLLNAFYSMPHCCSKSPAHFYIFFPLFSFRCTLLRRAWHLHQEVWGPLHIYSGDVWPAHGIRPPLGRPDCNKVRKALFTRRSPLYGSILCL